MAGRRRALRRALNEYDNARYFPDWPERRKIFAAIDWLDQQPESPEVLVAWDLFQTALADLNEKTEQG